MRNKVSAVARDGVLKFEGMMVTAGAGGNPGAVRKWFDAHQKKGPWVCGVCRASVGEDGERVVVYVDLADPNCFEVVHREHAD